MKAHELAKKLLEMPDWYVCIPKFKGHNTYENIVKLQKVKIDEVYKQAGYTEEYNVIKLIGPSFK